MTGEWGDWGAGRLGSAGRQGPREWGDWRAGRSGSRENGVSRETQTEGGGGGGGEAVTYKLVNILQYLTI